MLQSSSLKPEVYHRFVDDCLMIWCHGETELLHFIDHCNAQHPTIHFTWESSLQEKHVSYMDMALSISSDEQLEYELFQKPSDSGVNMHFNSCVPRFMKMSVVQQQFRRATALSSNREARERSHEKIRKLLRGNNFPEKEIMEAEQRSLQ